ncbi:MAG: glycosyltransferase family 2 protein [Phycisphaeraceae bacterium]
MAHPLFSIVIPTYNRRSLVGTALDSALAQDFDGDYEILVGDDGSTDGTPDFIEATYGDRVKVFRQDNAGPGPARNLAIRHATGEYLAFLDSDDAFLPWTLSVYRSLIDRHDKPAILIGNAYDTEDLDKPVELERTDTRSRRFDHLYASRNAVQLIATDRLTVRRDVFDEVGPFTGEVKNGEDIDFLARAGLASGYVVIDGPATFVRRHHPQQVSKEPSGAFEGRMFLLDQEDAGRYPGGKAYRTHRRELLSFWARVASMQMRRMGRADLGMKFYRRVFWWHVGLGRWKYLIAYPLMCLFGKGSSD